MNAGLFWNSTDTRSDAVLAQIADVERSVVLQIWTRPSEDLDLVILDLPDESHLAGVSQGSRIISWDMSLRIFRLLANLTTSSSHGKVDPQLRPPQMRTLQRAHISGCSCSLQPSGPEYFRLRLEFQGFLVPSLQI